MKVCVPTKATYVIIDDHDAIRLAVRLQLRDASWLEFAGEASDGAAGLALIERVRPAVAVVDVEMPEVDGLELTTVVVERALPTRIVLHSGLETPVIRHAATLAGASAFVAKGSPPGELLEALHVSLELRGGS